MHPISHTMTMTQFAMVEELASLIKDNLSCKHLVLSVEEALVNFLQDDTSPEGVLELQPMSSYHRLLLHRLADIYGFAHGSIGEGDDRHLVLERCPETAIPSILVSDILWQYDEFPSSAPSHNILRRTEAPVPKITETLPSLTTLEEREAAYLVARERIFSLHEDDEKEVIAPKSRKIPVVARRMIAHALGTKICTNTSDQDLLVQKFENIGPVESPSNSEESEDHIEASKGTGARICPREKKDKLAGESSSSTDASERKVHDRSVTSSSKINLSHGRAVGVENLEREQFGAAKRMFAHALGRPSGKGNHSSVKPGEGNRASS